MALAFSEWRTRDRETIPPIYFSVAFAMKKTGFRLSENGFGFFRMENKGS